MGKIDWKYELQTHKFILSELIIIMNPILLGGLQSLK